MFGVLVYRQGQLASWLPETHLVERRQNSHRAGSLPGLAGH